MKLRSPERAALRDMLTTGTRPRDIRRAAGVDTATRRWLIGAVMPLWLGAGLADWHRHRRTHIETTSGARESMIHGLMMTDAGVPVVLGLFCEINAGVPAPSPARTAGRTSASAASATRSHPAPAPRSSAPWPCSAPSRTPRR